ncbi:MAG: putative N-formylglutamate amidohydrolase [Planctomycetota bacterium]
MNLVLSNEHGGNRIPARYRALFKGAETILDSHRGWDPGSLQFAKQLAQCTRAPLAYCETSRLIVDLNRPLTHRKLFSEWTRPLPDEERQTLIRRWWQPHHAQVVENIEAGGRGPSLHLSLHSFVPVWEGEARKVDVGFLYDPSRQLEREFAGLWIEQIRQRAPALRVRRNQPYRGIDPGLIPVLRSRFSARSYVGIELEISQAFPLGPAAPWRKLRCDLIETFEVVLKEFD